MRKIMRLRKRPFDSTSSNDNSNDNNIPITVQPAHYYHQQQQHHQQQSRHAVLCRKITTCFNSAVTFLCSTSKSIVLFRQYYAFPQKQRKRRGTPGTIILIIIFFIAITKVFPSLYSVLFGNTSIYGGLLGQFIDCQIRNSIWKQTLYELKQQDEQYNIDFPDPVTHTSASTRTIPNAVVRDVWMKEYRMRWYKTEWMENYYTLFWSTCTNGDISRSSNVTHNPDSKSINSWSTLWNEMEKENSNRSIPQYILRPKRPLSLSSARDTTYRYGPIHDLPSSIPILSYDEQEQANFFQQHNYPMNNGTNHDTMMERLNQLHKDGGINPSTQPSEQHQSQQKSSVLSEQTREELWILSALYFQGGIYLTDEERFLHPLLQSNLYDKHDPTEISTSPSPMLCDDAVGHVSLYYPEKTKGRNEEEEQVNQQEEEEGTQEIIIHGLSVSIGHTFLKCLLEYSLSELDPTIRSLNATSDSTTPQHMNSKANIEGWSIWKGLTGLLTIMMQKQLLEKVQKNVNKNMDRSVQLYKLPNTCPHELLSPDLFQIPNTMMKEKTNNGDDNEIMTNIPVKKIHVTIQEENQPASASMTESETERKQQQREKVSLETSMAKQSIFCSRFWLWPCHRCLKAANYGTYHKCERLCGECFHRQVCSTNQHGDDERQIKDIVVNLVVKEAEHFQVAENRKSQHQPQPQRQRPSQHQQIYQLIPRIVHQTWFEELNPIKYPQLTRLQNSWQSKGWEYRFYTDKSARVYINENFPRRFLMAYDALIPGAYKADLFRYLVLLKDGGVYADVDVLLEKSLDDFITPAMSFFSPRDAIGEYANGQFCLWNGLIGAAPGHPFLTRAVERLLNLISMRADILDIENDIYDCDNPLLSKQREIWKLRAVQELVLSGPCALGIAVNEAMGNDPVGKIEAGWMTMPSSSMVDQHNLQYYGDAHILMQDKQDLGAMRFTDVERNILLASTDLPGITKNPMLQKGNARGNLKTHYHSTATENQIWGSALVYSDNIPTNDLMKFRSF